MGRPQAPLYAGEGPDTPTAHAPVCTGTSYILVKYSVNYNLRLRHLLKSIHVWPTNTRGERRIGSSG